MKRDRERSDPIRRTGEIRVRAFRAADEFVIETYRTSKALSRGHGDELAKETRRAVIRAGAVLVAASTRPPKTEDERGCLEIAKMGLAKARYYLYLARRFGLVDAKTYRALMSRHDAAVRELDAAIEPRRAPPRERPP